MMNDELLAKYLDQVMVQQYKSDIGFRTLVESVNENMYVIPKYQRKYRWKKEQLESLVHSLLRGLPIPPIYTCRNKENQLEILDGQQRVMSLFFYYIGYRLNYKKNNSIDFTELEVGNNSFGEALMQQYSMERLSIYLQDEDGNKLNADYASLPIEIKRRVDYTPITVIEIKISKQEKREEVLQTVFGNLNRKGSLLSKQEQRNGIYICGFYDMLHDFNKNNVAWRKIWGKEDAEEKDTEALVRFCALKKYVKIIKGKDGSFLFEMDRYNNSYADMLDRFSYEATGFEQDEIKQYEDSLEGFVKLFKADKVLSSKVALMEGFYVLYDKLGMEGKITKEIINQVLEADGYKTNSGQRTVNIKKMNGRWHAVYDVWSKCV